ncbi:MAG: hypothetical protein OM95_01755 [Bdellovibrio sp. ArHS]|uniref:hypothetical protein n=1 Tax=Bdellovibrio sp. ArHS TaxID=1569284 RepID=UPI000583E434|nr:hypothetical protein [Bdellovibrio sp. ArHS]KHD89814.1 MAG: hypothetical protein OM95_01755 [Bdellovibrio sp. ArHS]
MKKSTFRFRKQGVFLCAIAFALAYAATSHAASWNEMDIRADLYFMRGQEVYSGQDITENNRRLMEEINNFKPSSQHRIDGVSAQQAQAIIQKTNQNEVTGYRGGQKYDPKGIVGFCFGRALYAHLELLRHGVSKDAIKKVFVVGPMRTGSIDWQFHVTTIVKASDHSGWYAVDTFIGRPVPLEEWFKNFQKYSTDGKLRLFVTEPNKIGPSAWEYNVKPGGLMDPFYNNYFKDMFEYFKKNHLRPEEKFFPSCSKVFAT